MFLGGHTTQFGDRTDIELNKNLTMSVIENAAAAVSAIDFGGEAASTGAFTPEDPNFGNTWLAFRRPLDLLKKICARATIEQFGCRLAAIDVTAESHCAVAANLIRVDI